MARNPSNPAIDYLEHGANSSITYRYADAYRHGYGYTYTYGHEYVFLDTSYWWVYDRHKHTDTHEYEYGYTDTYNEEDKRMAKIVAVCNQKGGVAKTTTACALATGLAKRGYKVLMVDTDSQRNTTSVYRAETEGVATIHDLLFTRGIDPAICIQHTEIGDIIASDALMAKDDANLNGVRESLMLRKALVPFLDHYDYIVLDHNPGHGGILNNVLTAANDIIIPMQTDGFSIDGAADLAERINSVKEFTNPGLRVAGVVVTMCNARYRSAREFFAQKEVLERVFDTKVFDATIRRCQALADANTSRMSIFDYDPRGNGAADYNAMIDEYLKGVQ